MTPVHQAWYEPHALGQLDKHQEAFQLFRGEDGRFVVRLKFTQELFGDLCVVAELEPVSLLVVRLLPLLALTHAVVFLHQLISLSSNTCGSRNTRWGRMLGK